MQREGSCNEQSYLASHWWCCCLMNGQWAVRKHLIIVICGLLEHSYWWPHLEGNCSSHLLFWVGNFIYRYQLMCWEGWIIFHGDWGCDWFGFEHMWAFLWHFPLHWTCRELLAYGCAFCGQVGTTLTPGEVGSCILLLSPCYQWQRKKISIGQALALWHHWPYVGAMQLMHTQGRGRHPWPCVGPMQLMHVCGRGRHPWPYVGSMQLMHTGGRGRHPWPCVGPMQLMHAWGRGRHPWPCVGPMQQMHIWGRGRHPWPCVGPIQLMHTWGRGRHPWPCVGPMLLIHAWGRGRQGVVCWYFSLLWGRCGYLYIDILMLGLRCWPCSLYDFPICDFLVVPHLDMGDVLLTVVSDHWVSIY